MSRDGEGAQQLRRVLTFMGSQEVTLEAADSGTATLHGARGVIGVRMTIIAAAVEQGLVARSGDTLRVTETGKVVRQQLVDPLQAQHRFLEQTEMQTEDGWETVTVNLAESPLGQIARRRDREGRRYLSDAELRAGERLRMDFTRGQMTPKLGATWQAVASSGRRGGGAGASVDLTDAALAARQRVDRAVDATGPELSGVLLDICCFLKGLEQVEAERGWPVRSGKVMLKAALGALARHYEPSGAGSARRSFHWGTEDYRPTVR